MIYQTFGAGWPAFFPWGLQSFCHKTGLFRTFLGTKNAAWGKLGGKQKLGESHGISTKICGKLGEKDGEDWGISRKNMATVDVWEELDLFFIARGNF